MSLLSLLLLLLQMSPSSSLLLTGSINLSFLIIIIIIIIIIIKVLYYIFIMNKLHSLVLYNILVVSSVITWLLTHYIVHIYVFCVLESMDLPYMWVCWVWPIRRGPRIRPFQRDVTYVLDGAGQQSCVGLCGGQLCAQTGAEQSRW